MKNEFTEGPYRVVSGLIVDQHDNVVADCRSMERLDPDSGEIKPHMSANKAPHISPVEAGNNAHLLAASTEMLKVLDLFMQAYENMERKQTDMTAFALAHRFADLVKPVIAKARRK